MDLRLMYDWLAQVIAENNKMMQPTGAYTDVVELCALLQCLGFGVKSLTPGDSNVSQDGGVSVTINCQASGLNVVLESVTPGCSCPLEANQQNSGMWQVSGVSGGRQLDKEFGCSILGSLPKAHRDRLAKELHTIIQCIKVNNESEAEKSKERTNRSASMLEMKVTPDERHSLIKEETPTRYRSLDTLTARDSAQPLPLPGQLQKKLDLTDTSADDVTQDAKIKKAGCQRQATYMISSPGSVKNRNKTSSPIQSKNVVLENLLAAEKVAEDLHRHLAVIIKQFGEEGRDESSMSSLVLDVSKISILKSAEPMKAQFASSPNLSPALGTVYEDMKKNRLQRTDTAPISLIPSKQTPTGEGGVASKLRRISPNFFKSKRDSLAGKADKPKVQDNKSSKLNSIFKPNSKPTRPVTPKFKSESSPNLSSTKKRFSHIKSTIPRPTPKKE